MTYLVTISKAHEASREVGQFDSLEDALTAAYQAGAVCNDNRMERFEQNSHVRDVCLDVRGHVGDDDYGIWIERK